MDSAIHWDGSSSWASLSYPTATSCKALKMSNVLWVESLRVHMNVPIAGLLPVRQMWHVLQCCKQPLALASSTDSL